MDKQDSGATHHFSYAAKSGSSQLDSLPPLITALVGIGICCVNLALVLSGGSESFFPQC